MFPNFSFPPKFEIEKPSSRKMVGARRVNLRNKAVTNKEQEQKQGKVGPCWESAHSTCWQK